MKKLQLKNKRQQRSYSTSEIHNTTEKQEPTNVWSTSEIQTAIEKQEATAVVMYLNQVVAGHQV